MPDDIKRWLEELRADWRELRKEVVEVLRWQAETRPMCDSHSKRIDDHEDRLRAMEKTQQETNSGLAAGLSVGTKALLFGGWIITTGIAVAAMLLK